MLKDRREHLENDVKKLTNKCGEMYLDIVTQTKEPPIKTYHIEYEHYLKELMRLRTELSIVDELIKQGKE